MIIESNTEANRNKSLELFQSNDPTKKIKTAGMQLEKLKFTAFLRYIRQFSIGRLTNQQSAR